MINELLLIGSLIFIFGTTLLFYKMFGKTGLYIMTAVATITANIECLIMINAFGMEQTLGNVFFAVTFVITDILSENHSKKEADRAIIIGIVTSLFFVLITQGWMLYVPSSTDWVMPSIRGVFTNTPRMMFSSLIVYAVSQFLDVRLYHLWWKFTNKMCGDKNRFLWVRNNGSTLFSQLINTVLFTLCAFVGMYDVSTLLSIMLSSYVIYIFTSLCDTPIVYLARKMNQKELIPNI